MKKLPLLGLVVEGKLTNSALLRSPSVLRQLGPVKAKTSRLARRATNFLQAGTPVESYEHFDEVKTILLHVPDSAVAATIAELSEAPLKFPEKTFVLCESWMSTHALQPLRRLGASTATCIAIPMGRGKCFILEGNPGVTRPLRRMLDRDEARAIEIREHRKDLIFGAQLLAGILPMALLDRAEGALRACSLSGRQLRWLLDGVVQKMVQDAATPHRPRAAPALRRCPPEVARDHLCMLAATDPELSEFVQQQLASSGLADILRTSAKLNKDEQAVPLEVETA